MALLARNSNYLLIAAKREVIIYGGNKENYNVVKLPAAASVVDGSTTKSKQQIDSDDDSENATNNNHSNDDIIEIKFSDDKKYLVAYTQLKEVFVYGWADDTIELKFVKNVPRVPSATCFSPDSNILVVADKTGDCYAIQTHDSATQPTWILGHLSMVLDVLFSADGKLIVTSDRDEKIRLTRYPKSHIIENYCLGHSEYVSSIKLLPHATDTLISVSGDLKLKVWKFLEGKELEEIAISAPGYKLYTKQVDDSASIVACVTYTLDEIFIYRFAVAEVKLTAHLKFPNQIVSSVEFNERDADLLVALLNCEGAVEIVRHSASKEYGACEQSDDELNGIVEKHFRNLVLNATNELSLMFKKKFDNVKEYHEKKRKRIEGKN